MEVLPDIPGKALKYLSTARTLNRINTVVSLCCAPRYCGRIFRSELLEVPRFRRIDIGICGIAGLAGVVQRPLLGKVRVIGTRLRRGDDVVGLGVLST